MARSILRGFVVRMMVFCLLGISLQQPALAGMVGTEQLTAADARATQVAQVQDFLARADVRAQLERWGVAPELAAERVAALSNAELQMLAQRISEQPAGGDSALAIIGIVFLVLLILELVGVINVFSRF